MTLDDLDGACRQCCWRLHGYGAHASFSAWGFVGGCMVKVCVRRKTRETIDAMLTRGLALFHDRVLVGMPTVKPRKADARLRAAAGKRFREMGTSGRVS